MAKFVSPWLLVLLAAALAKAVLDLTAEREVKGVWMASANLPCTYEPSVFFKEEIVIWKQGGRIIFYRDSESGDQTLVTAFRGRISVSKETLGDASLQILELHMADSGLYNCEVTWEATRNKTRMTKSASTRLRVEKVPVTKPELIPSHLGHALPRGTRIHLSCAAQGSPPIRYHWFKEVPGDNPIMVAAKDVLVFDNLQQSDEGTYYCVVENRVRTTIQRSDAIRLTVEGSIESSSNTTVMDQPGFRKAGLPLYIIILLAALGAGLIVAAISVTFCRRKTKAAQSYGITYKNNAANITSREAPPVPQEIPGPIGCEYEDPTSCIGNPYHPEPTKCNEYVIMGEKMDNEYEFLVDKMDSEYETIGTK